MWVISEHKAEQLVDKLVFLEYSFKIISGGKFSVIFSMGHFHRKVDIESTNENRVF